MRKGRKKQRLVLIGTVGSVLLIAVGLVLFGLSDQITLFKSPSDIAQEGLQPGIKIRVGGLVEEGSWKREGTRHRFTVTDTANVINVTYTGILPDLFREGQGVVLEGEADTGGVFHASTVLAKHDENYVPREVVDALKEQGVWQEGAGAPKTN